MNNAIPAGIYTAQITGADILPNKSGGRYLKVMFKLLHPSYSGRKLVSSINFENASQKARDIGLRELRELRVACDNVKDPKAMLGKVIDIKVIQETGNVKFPNDVVGYAAHLEQKQKQAQKQEPKSHDLLARLDSIANELSELRLMVQQIF